MIQTKYFVDHNGQQLGPFGFEEITAKLETGEILATDYIYDEIEKDWFMIAAHSAFLHLQQNQKPQQTPPHVLISNNPETQAQNVSENQIVEASNTSSVDRAEWYILKASNKFGPYTYFDVIGLLQSRTVFEFDFAWNPKYESWSKIADLAEFHPDKIKELKNSTAPHLSEVFFRRRYIRFRYGSSLILHDDQKTYKAHSLDLSVGGASFEIDTKSFQLGQSIHIHFKPGDGVPAFNARCEIVSKRELDSSKTLYGVKFLVLTDVTKSQLSNMSEKASDDIRKAA